MAVSIVFSTLMVLLSKTGQDFETLWNTTGGVNDPSHEKHSLDIAEIIRGGNFRSAVVDSWDTEEFDSVSVYGMNIFGDILWETEFNMTGKPSPLTSWLLGGQIIGSSAETGGSQNVIFNDQNYKLRLSPIDGMSWFAVSDVELSYGPLPLIFVPRSSYVPFADPLILDGPLGCWSLNDLLNPVKIYEDLTGMSVAGCKAGCWDNATVAVLVKAEECYCADLNAALPPTDTPSQCYFDCPNSSDKCGGFSNTAGNAYHVQGSKLPGYLETEVLYSAVRPIIDNVIQIDILDVFAMPTVPMFISRINVNTTDTTGSMTPTYTVQYNESDCTTSDGHMKTVAYDGDTIFLANGTHSDVNILKVRCIELIFSYPVPEAVVELWGPDVSSDHVEVPALVIRGKVYTETTTTTSTTSTLPTTTSTSPTTTSSTLPTTTSTSPTTTSSTLPTTTSTSPTTTSSTLPTTTTSTSPTTTSSTLPTTTSTSPITTSTTPVTSTTSTSQSSTSSTTTTNSSPSTSTTSTTNTTSIPSTSSSILTTTSSPTTTTTSTTLSTTPSPTTTTTPTTLSTTPSPTTTTTTTTLSTTTSTTTSSSSTSSPPSITTSPSTSSEPTTVTSTTTSAPSTSTTSSSTTSSASSAATSTATSSSSTSESTPVQTTTKSTCHCPCNITLPKLNLTTAELQAKIIEIQRRLAVNVSVLSSTIRRLTSAEDSRVSAVSIGYIGVGILISIFGSIVFIDSAMLFKDVKKLINNIKTGLCPRTVESSPQS